MTKNCPSRAARKPGPRCRWSSRSPPPLHVHVHAPLPGAETEAESGFSPLEGAPAYAASAASAPLAGQKRPASVAAGRRSSRASRSVRGLVLQLPAAAFRLHGRRRRRCSSRCSGCERHRFGGRLGHRWCDAAALSSLAALAPMALGLRRSGLCWAALPGTLAAMASSAILFAATSLDGGCEASCVRA